MPEEKKDKSIILWVILVILVVLGIVFWLFFYNPKVIISVNPNNAIIKIDGVTINSGLKAKTTIGSHTVTVSANNYVPYEKKVNLKMGQIFRLSLELKTIPQAEQILNTKIYFPTLANDNKSIFYLGDNKKVIYKLSETADNKIDVSAITPEIPIDIKDIIWSPDKNLALIRGVNDEITLYDFKRYDLLHQEMHAWGSNIGNMIWAPTSDSIVYYYHPQGGEETLIRSNKDHTDLERIYNFKDTSTKNPTLAWSNDGKKIIVLADKLYLFDLYYKNLATIVDGTVTNAVFTPNSQKIIYSNNEGIFSIGIDGKNKEKLDVTLNLGNIAWFDSTSLVSFIQEKITQFSLTEKRAVPFLYQNTPPLTGSNLVLRTSDDTLFFTANNNLYKLVLASQIY